MWINDLFYYTAIYYANKSIHPREPLSFYIHCKNVILLRGSIRTILIRLTSTLSFGLILIKRQDLCKGKMYVFIFALWQAPQIFIILKFCSRLLMLERSVGIKL